MDNLIFIGIVFLGLIGFLWMAGDRSPKQELSLKVSGDIVWSREFSWKKKKIVALGFRFKDMSPKFKGMFFMMADSICYDGGKRR